MIPAPPPPWQRPRYVAAGPARFAYVALLPEGVELAGPNKDHPLFAGIKLEVRWKSDDAAWYAGWTDPKSTFGSVLLRTPGVDIVALQRCQAAVVLSGVVDDPKDLGHVQRCFALLRLLVRAGAVVACDVEAMLWWTSEQLSELTDDWEFDVADHMRVIFEAAEREPGSGHLAHTLGLAKFGRPDLAIGGLAREHAEAAGEMLENLATALAEGDNFEGGDIVEPEGFPPLRCEEVPDDSGTPDATFGNASLWLVPEEAT